MTMYFKEAIKILYSVFCILYSATEYQMTHLQIIYNTWHAIANLPTGDLPFLEE